MPLETFDAVCIRPYTQEDLGKIFSYCSLSQVKTSLPYYPLETEKLLSEHFSHFQENGESIYIVERSGKIVGHFVLFAIDTTNAWAEYFVAFEPSCSEALASFAIHLFNEHLFKNNMNKIILLATPENHFFFELARKLSLMYEGTIRQYVRSNGIYYDTLFFSTLQTDKETKLPSKTLLQAIPSQDLDILQKKAYSEGKDVVNVRAIILRKAPGKAPEGLELLLLKRAAGTPFAGLEEPPGGTVLEKESLLVALFRTVEEQTGVKLQDVRFLTSTDLTLNEKKIREFVFRGTSPSFQITLQDKLHDSVTWIPLQNLLETNLHPDLIKILADSSKNIVFDATFKLGHEHEPSIELIRPLITDSERALLGGIHLNTYAAKGLGAIERFGFFIHDEIGAIVGGLSGEIAYGALKIEHLWVDPDFRKSGWGTKLLRKAENLAKEKGCTFVTGEAMDWESISFFQKMSYYIEWQRTGYLAGSRQFFLRKELS